MRTCITCRHCDYPHVLNGASNLIRLEASCSASEANKIDPVFGTRVNSCLDVRKEGEACGPDGRMWKAKKPST